MCVTAIQAQTKTHHRVETGPAKISDVLVSKVGSKPLGCYPPFCAAGTRHLVIRFWARELRSDGSWARVQLAGDIKVDELMRGVLGSFDARVRVI